MAASHLGPAIGAAACEAGSAFRALARMSLHLDAVGLEVQDGVAEIISGVGDIAAGLTDLADEIGAGEVDGRGKST